MEDVEEVVKEINSLEKHILTSIGMKHLLKKRVEEFVEECDVLKMKVNMLKKELLQSTGAKDELKKKIDDSAKERNTLKRIINTSKNNMEKPSHRVRKWRIEIVDIRIKHLLLTEKMTTIL